jgi:Flp pilus assembly protein TadB
VAIDDAVAEVGGVVVALAFGTVTFGPVVGVLAGIAAGVARPAARRLRSRRRAAAVASAVPDLVDLFLVAASAGRPVAGSLAVVAPRAPPAVASAVRLAAGRLRRGQRLAECLGQLGDQLGPSATPLTDALRQAALTGAPLVPLLEGVAAAARDRRRRRSQEVARRLPVTMLLPLVACILPAAILLAVVPVLLVSVSSLAP